MDLHFGCGVLAVEIFGESGNRADGAEHSARSIPGKGRYRGLHLVNDIREPIVGMKEEVARSCAWMDTGRRRIVSDEGPIGWVEAIDQQLVQAEVRGHRKPVVQRHINRVRVRAFL